MATDRPQEPTCRIVKDRTLTLETKAGLFTSIALIEDKFIVVTEYDARNLQIYNCLDGKLIYQSERLGSLPIDVCLINNHELAVCLDENIIEIFSVKSVDDVKRINTLNVGPTFRVYYSVTKWKSDKLIVSGKRTGRMFCWGVVSITDGTFESVHDIVQGELSGCTHVAIKDNKIYISCQTGDSIADGVYAYDICNPNKPELYQNQELKNPWSIITVSNFVYVSDWNSERIHQLTDSCQLVTIHRVSSNLDNIFFDEQHGIFYATADESNKITVYKMEYLHQQGIPVEILNMDDRSIQLYEEALKDGMETIYNIRIMVVGPMGVGKTTLVKRLLGEEVNISEKCSTEGIDVYVNCCDVSLLTREWSRRGKDSGDFKLQRLVKVLHQNHQTKRNRADQEQNVIPPQQGEHVLNPIVVVADDDKDTEIVYQHSDMNSNIDQNLSSTKSNLEESPSTDVQEIHSEHGNDDEERPTKRHKIDPLREMLKLLNENQDKAKMDVKMYAHLSVWDFAGQSAFYTTHQMFLTRRAIYLLVADVSGQIEDVVEDDCYLNTKGRMKCKVHELTDIWMNSIHSCAPSDSEDINSANSPTSTNTVIPPPVILVGTHVDQIKEPDCHKRGMEYLKEIRSYLGDNPAVYHLVDEDFALDNSIVDSRLEELRRTIVEVASKQSYWGEKIPTRWFLLEQQLMKLRDSGVKVIPRSTVEELNNEGTIQIKESEELDLFLTYLHETGTIIYFSIEILRDNIILDPKWLIDALKCLINGNPYLPESVTENKPQSSISTCKESQPHIPTDSDAGSSSQSIVSTESTITQKWSDFCEKGVLSSELVGAIWTQDKHPELNTHKDHLLMTMEQFNIIAKPRSFREFGEKVENYYLVPCMLRQESPKRVISLVQDSNIVSSSVLCIVFTGKYLPPPIFHRLIAACITRWPIAKEKTTSRHLVFCGCCVFDIDLFHRLTLHFRKHVIYARITKMVTDDVKSIDARLCTRVRKFITLNLSKITSYLGQNLQYEMRIQCPTSQCMCKDNMPDWSEPVDMWLVDELHDPDTPITDEHMNHARLCVALATICGKVMRDILRTYVPANCTDIYHAILSNRVMLTTSQRGERPLLSHDQSQLVFPSYHGQNTGRLEQFDISLLYILIRNISTVQAPSKGWGNDPCDQPSRETSLGASVERIRSYRNYIVHRIPEGKINQQVFQDYWKKFEYVLRDIEAVLGEQAYSQELGRHRRQVISIYEAC